MAIFLLINFLVQQWRQRIVCVKNHILLENSLILSITFLQTVTNLIKNSWALLFNYPSLLHVQHFTVSTVSRLFTIQEVSITFVTPFLNIRKKIVRRCSIFVFLQWTWMTTIILDPRQLRACPGPDPSHGPSTPDRRRDFSTLGPRQVLPSLGPSRACSSPGLRLASCYRREDQADQVYTHRLVFILLW
jgi:hypothetical protein